MRDEHGFTLVEVLAAMLLVFLLSAISFPALRNFARVQEIGGARDEVITQLRQVQGRAVSESHPLVFGARFNIGARRYSIFRYNPETGVCGNIEHRSLPGNVSVSAADFADEGVAARGVCSTALGGSGEFLFFFPRGSATEGSVRLTHGTSNRSLSVTVSGITGRVDES